MSKKELPELLLWKVRAAYYEAELALHKAQDAVRRRDDLVSSVRDQILAELPEGMALLEIDIEAGVYLVGVAADAASASIAIPTSKEGNGHGHD
jgi:hypothetical protein